MTTLVINYDSLTRVANNASNLSSRAETYANDLTNKVYDKFSSISGGSSTYTADAKYYVKAKINALEAKKNSYATLSTQINTFVETAKRVDEQVERTIALNQETFLSKNEHLRIDDWKASILNWLVDVKNICPVFEIIGNALKDAETAVTDLIANIKYWYKCEGGKEWIAFVCSILLTIASILLLGAAIVSVIGVVVGTTAITLTLVCQVIGALIGVANAVTNMVTSRQAVNSALNEDPAWAKIYGNQDTVSDILRQTNFNNGLGNRLSYVVATTIDTVNLFCDAVNFVDMASHLKSKFSCIQNYFNKNHGGLLTYFKEAKYVEALDYDEFGNICGTKWTLATNSEGVVETRFTARSVWRGIKAFVMDQPISCDSDLGIRTMLNQNFKIDFTDWKKSLSITGLKETISYNLKNNRIKGIVKVRSLNYTSYALKDASKKVKAVSTFITKIGDVIDGSYNFKGDIGHTVYNFTDFSEVFDKTGISKIIGNKLDWKYTKNGIIQNIWNTINNTYIYKTS